MKFITSNNKKLVVLAAVVILCAACLVTVAYAYNAEYKDSVEQISITPSETSKYIYIDGNGLSYGSNPITVNVEIQYGTVYDNTSSDNKITYKPYGYSITGFPENSVASLDNGVATVYLGDIVVRNSHTDASTVKLSVDESSFSQSKLSSKEQSLFKSDVSYDQIKFKVGESYVETVTFGTSDKVTVGVYVVAQIVDPVTSVQLPSEERSYSSPSEFQPITSTNLYLPGLNFTIKADATDVATYTNGTVDASEMSSIKANSNVQLKIKTSDGASILLNTAAVNALSASETSFTVSKNDTAPSDADAVYDITLVQDGNPVTFASTDNASLIITVPYDGSERNLADGDTVSVAYVSNGAVSDLINGTYNAIDKTVSFETTHLSTYAIMKTTSVAKIVTDTAATGYATLASAVSAAMDGQTVTLLSDVTEDITVSNKVTIDLSGYTVKGSAADTITVNNGAELILTDSSSNAGTVYSDVSGRSALYNNGTVTIKNIEVQRHGTEYYAILNHGVMTIDGATVTSNVIGSALIDNGYYDYTSSNARNGYVSGTGAEAPTLKVTAGTFTGGKYNVKNDDNATLTIDGGNFSGSADATILNNNVFVLNGGTITASKDHFLAIASVYYASNYNAGALTINGGTVNGGIGLAAIDHYTLGTNVAPSEDVWLSSTSNTDLINLSKAAAYTVSSDVVTYYGEDVTLASNLVLSSPLVVYGTMALNLNKKTISNTVEIWNTDKDNWSLVSVRNGDLTINGDGSLKAKENDCYAADIQGGKLTINGGSYLGNLSAVYVHNGALVINGGSFDITQLYHGKEYAFEINCLDANYKNGTATVSIAGGSFVNFDPSANAAESNDNTTNFLALGYSVSSDADSSSKTIYTVAVASDSSEETTA